MMKGPSDPGKRGMPAWLLVALMVLATSGVLYGIKVFVVGDSGATTEAVLRRSAKNVFGQSDYSTDRRPYRALSSLPSSGSSKFSGKYSSAREKSSYGPAASGGARRGAAPASGREREFLRRHDKEIAAYQAYLRRLGQRARAKHPAVRAMDSEFARMDRYVALTQQYERDRDAYKWARGVMALPEVRRALGKYSRDPGVVLALTEVSLTALKNPPSPAVFNEIMRFICAPEQSGYVGSVSNDVMNGAAAGIAAGMQAGMDMTPLISLGDQISAGIGKQGGAGARRQSR